MPFLALFHWFRIFLLGFLRADPSYLSLLSNAVKDFLLGHLFIIILAVILGWFANSLKEDLAKFPEPLREPLHFLILVLLVLPIATWGRYSAETERRVRGAEEARTKADRASSSTVSELVATSVSYPASRLIILSEGIGKITTRTFDVVDNTYPAAQLRTLSVFVDLGNQAECDDNVLPGCIEDIVQEGKLEKDLRYFKKENSLVGAAIKDRKRYYCPDLTNPSSDAACEKFHRAPAAGDPSFASVVCYPLTFLAQPNKPNAPDMGPFAAICLDSKKKHAFDSEITIEQDHLWESISVPAGLLATLLYEFQQVRRTPVLRKALEYNQAMKQVNF
ncbi:MAG TPA: hypothetical protein VHQ22_18335 [Terriglobales bacterium]|jgi:hypothetical protein|nr:hypothetical protein [Terriglobales bacterium]